MLQVNLQHSFCEISKSTMQIALLLFTSEARLLDAFGKSKVGYRVISILVPEYRS
jgi:hypothetical protein